MGRCPFCDFSESDVVAYTDERCVAVSRDPSTDTI